MNENINGITLGMFIVVDPDNTDTHTYTLANDGGGKFTLTQTGQLSVADGTIVASSILGCGY